MTSATVAGTTTVYAQNALGQRVRKTTAGVSTLFAYDESGHLLGEYTGSGELIREYVWLGDIPVAVITGGPGTPPYVFWYLHTDHLNAPRSVENPTTGELVWRWDAAPFGETAPNEDPDGDLNPFTLPLRFPGQYADQETGLYYNFFRDYEPQSGRYVESDPGGLYAGINTYGYGYNSPLLVVDPLGLEGWYCQRRLGKPPGKRGPWVLNHQYLCVTRLDGTIECGSQSYEDSFLWDKGRPTRPDEDYFNENSCIRIDDNTNRCFERCVLTNFKKARPRYAIGPQGTDCQEWSDSIRDGCKLVCSRFWKSADRLFPGVK